MYYVYKLTLRRGDVVFSSQSNLCKILINDNVKKNDDWMQLDHMLNKIYQDVSLINRIH